MTLNSAPYEPSPDSSAGGAGRPPGRDPLGRPGQPFRRHFRWYFDPARARPTGLGPVQSPFYGSHVVGVDHGPGPVETSCRVRLGASSTTGNCCQTSATFQSRNRRRHVMPEPKPNSCGRNSHWAPVCGTNKMAHSTFRSGSGLRPGCRELRSLHGRSGSIRAHKSSETIHGEAPVPGHRRTPYADTATKAEHPNVLAVVSPTRIGRHHQSGTHPHPRMGMSR